MEETQGSIEPLVPTWLAIMNACLMIDKLMISNIKDFLGLMHENLHKNVNKNTISFTFLCNFS